MIYGPNMQDVHNSSLSELWKYTCSLAQSEVTLCIGLNDLDFE